jgi:hypothetical protein
MWLAYDFFRFVSRPLIGNSQYKVTTLRLVSATLVLPHERLLRTDSHSLKANNYLFATRNALATKIRAI